MTQSLTLSLSRGVVKCPLIHGFPVASCQWCATAAEEPHLCDCYNPIPLSGQSLAHQNGKRYDYLLDENRQ